MLSHDVWKRFREVVQLRQYYAMELHAKEVQVACCRL